MLLQEKMKRRQPGDQQHLCAGRTGKGKYGKGQ